MVLFTPHAPGFIHPSVVLFLTEGTDRLVVRRRLQHDAHGRLRRLDDAARDGEDVIGQLSGVEDRHPLLQGEQNHVVTW